MASISEAPTSPVSRKVPRATKRSKLRNSTFVIPGTGRRANRQITLREANLDGSSSRRSSDDAFQQFDRRWSSAGNVDTAFHNAWVSLKMLWDWLRSPVGKGIIKCSLCYLLGCMGTLLPPLANFLGHQDGKHVVATMVTYFHPARSAGSMIEAVLLMFVAVAYAIFIGVSSMTVAVVCETQFGLIELGYVIVLFVFIGGGLGFVGWTKQKMGSPLVNVACSLTSLSIITIVTKENAVQTAVFSNNKIFQVLKMLTLAVTFTVSVNLIIWPVSARRDLHKAMITATDTLGEQLTTITHSFLSGSEADLTSADFETLLKKFKTTFVSLKKNLREAKFEHYFLGREAEYRLEARLVKSMQQLAQSIGGLRSAADTQFTLLRESSNMGIATPVNNGRWDNSQISGNVVESTVRIKPDRFAVLAAIDEAENETSDAELWGSNDDLAHSATLAGAPSTYMPTLHSPSEIFSQFILQLGPSMKSLAYTLSQMLDELPFGPGPQFDIKINDNFSNSLADALALYSDHRTEAIRHLYRSKELARERSRSIEADFEEVAASCGYFSFCLQDFAEEMQNYLEALEDLKVEADNTGKRTWNWMKFWRRSGSNEEGRKRAQVSEDEEFLIQEQAADGNPDAEADENQVKDVPDVQSKKDKAPLPEDFTIQEAITAIFLPILEFLERDDIRFALKVGIGASLWALLAFIPETRPFYNHWRGEWGLLSMMLVCSMTVGASNTTGYARFLGTLIGATLAIISWLICQGNPFALAGCCFVVSFYCFYLITAANQASYGRFILLTYNLSALYAYSLSVKDSDDDDDEGGVSPIISEIALHRVVAVVSGVVWGLIVTRMIWPISARQKFKDGLSVLWLRMGLIWGRDPLSAISNGTPSNAYMNFREELALQKYVSRLDSLRTSATSEYELRGPFQAAAYGRIMQSTNKMLDAFHSLNSVIKKDLRANEAEKAILAFTIKEREQLCQRISHLFQVLASSMKLEYPVSSVIPSTESARDRLLSRVFLYRKLAGRFAGGHVEGTRPSSSSGVLNGYDNGNEDSSNIPYFDGPASSRLQKSKSVPSLKKDSSVASHTSQAGHVSFASVQRNTSYGSLTSEGERQWRQDEADESIVVETGDEDYSLLYAYALVTGQISEEIRKCEIELGNLFGVVDCELGVLY